MHVSFVFKSQAIKSFSQRKSSQNFILWKIISKSKLLSSHIYFYPLFFNYRTKNKLPVIDAFSSKALQRITLNLAHCAVLPMCPTRQPYIRGREGKYNTQQLAAVSSYQPSTDFIRNKHVARARRVYKKMRELASFVLLFAESAKCRAVPLNTVVQQCCDSTNVPLFCKCV